jgi:integrase/recombinase XerD
MLLSQAVSDYLTYLRVRKGCSTTTIDTYKYILSNFITVVGNVDVSDVTVKTIDAYALNISLKNPRPKTFRNKMVPVRCLVAYLYKNDLVTLKPEQVELPKDHAAEANFLTEPEQTKLLRKVKDVRDRAMILTLLTSGVRVSELTDLRVADVYKRSVAVRKGKGSKPRVTFITPVAQKAIEDYLKQCSRTDGYLFANPYGARLSRVVVARKVRHYAKKAGITKTVTAHTLRHSFATTMLKRGARVEDVQKILGHSNIKTTLIYLHFTNADLEKSYNKVMLK